MQVSEQQREERAALLRRFLPVERIDLPDPDRDEGVARRIDDPEGEVERRIRRFEYEIDRADLPEIDLPVRQPRRNDEDAAGIGRQGTARHDVAAPSAGDQNQLRAVVPVQRRVPAAGIPAAVKKFRFH